MNSRNLAGRTMTSKRGKSDFLELVKSDGRRPPKPPHLLALIQQNALERSAQLLKRMFLAADDVLYELSQRASSHGDEKLYFDAMREFRLKTQGISRQFRQNIILNFSDILDTESASRKGPTISANTLSIMDGDQLETDLALTNMTNRARDLYRAPLHELNVRLNHLLRRVEVDSSNSPLDPHRIARAFVEGCAATLRIDIKVRLILFKLFEKHLLMQLAPLYDEANQLLVNAGILPTIPEELHKEEAPPSEAAKKQPAESPAAPTPEPDESLYFNVSFEKLAAFFAAARGAAQASNGEKGALSISCCIFATGNPGPLMSAPQLTSMLTRSQLMADRQLVKGPCNIVPGIITALLTKADANAPQALAEPDETTINLVSLFFDEILADDHLPLAIQALICRLQIPVLKIALKDRSFFSNHHHAARNLINTITAVGIGFEETRSLERDPVYRCMVDIVQTISREQKIDDAIFSNLQRDLEVLIAAEQRKVQIVEKRTSQSAEGRARIRIARTNSQNFLYSKLQGIELLPEIMDFLTTTWLQVLIISQLKHGWDSEEWMANGRAAIDLIELCQKRDTRPSKPQPKLLQRIESGLEAAIESPQVRAASVEDLRAALDVMSRNATQVNYSPLSDAHREALGRSEIRPSMGFAASRIQEPAAEFAISVQHTELAKKIEKGSWVEYVNDRSGEKFRYKLAAKIDAATYVFVNRKGFKTIERTCRQLANDFALGKARLLTSGEFVDRMMNKVLSNIRQAA
jgi:hypothetical protein